jgi:hypothetical protein
LCSRYSYGMASNNTGGQSPADISTAELVRQHPESKRVFDILNELAGRMDAALDQDIEGPHSEVLEAFDVLVLELQQFVSKLPVTQNA